MRKCGVLAALVILTSVGGCRSEQGDWDEVRSDPTVAGLEEFIARYPQGEYVEQAERLRIEAGALLSAIEEGGEQALREFMTEYPESELGATALEAHDSLVAQAFSTLTPDHLMIIDDFGLVDLVPNSEGTIEMRPMVQWRGEHRYSLGEGGVFTGAITFVPPDPTSTDVVIAVVDDFDLTEPLRAGYAYLWRGGDFIYEWQDISAWGSPNEIAARLEMPPSTEYVALAPELVAN